MLNDFGSLRYCQDCEKWVETCRHFQHESKPWVSLVWTITDQQPVTDEQPEAEPEQKRHWWERWK